MDILCRLLKAVEQALVCLDKIGNGVGIDDFARLSRYKSVCRALTRSCGR
jgi:hypothetical protein